MQKRGKKLGPAMVAVGFMWGRGCLCCNLTRFHFRILTMTTGLTSDCIMFCWVCFIVHRFPINSNIICVIENKKGLVINISVSQSPSLSPNPSTQGRVRVESESFAVWVTKNTTRVRVPDSSPTSLSYIYIGLAGKGLKSSLPTYIWECGWSLNWMIDD